MLWNEIWNIKVIQIFFWKLNLRRNKKKNYFTSAYQYTFPLNYKQQQQKFLCSRLSNKKKEQTLCVTCCPTHKHWHFCCCCKPTNHSVSKCFRFNKYIAYKCVEIDNFYSINKLKIIIIIIYKRNRWR
jgi:hypothetical protein